jgi:hypothetical protein
VPGDVVTLAPADVPGQSTTAATPGTTRRTEGGERA